VVTTHYFDVEAQNVHEAEARISVGPVDEVYLKEGVTPLECLESDKIKEIHGNHPPEEFKMMVKVAS
jgi:hypothetical protein